MDQYTDLWVIDSLPTLKPSNPQTLKPSNSQTLKLSNLQTLSRANVPRSIPSNPLFQIPLIRSVNRGFAKHDFKNRSFYRFWKCLIFSGLFFVFKINF